jgi:hypothetical protein
MPDPYLLTASLLRPLSLEDTIDDVCTFEQRERERERGKGEKRRRRRRRRRMAV